MASGLSSVKFAACTVVARNYMAFARVLEGSFLEANPGINFFTLIIDGTEADLEEHGTGQVLLLDDLGLDPDVLEPMVVMYSVMELATALKPALLQALLGRGYEAVSYFDPDIWVFAGLTDLFRDAADRGVVLTPHALSPIVRDGLEISEKTIMHSGIFNLGFITVGASATEFLAWWHERLRTDAVVDFDNALFTDQRWIDWVPALFDHTIARDRGLNVAYWNVHERPLTRTPQGSLCAGGAPLRFFHFSGFDRRSPWLLSRFMGEQPRVLLSEQPVLRELCEAYADKLQAYDHERLRARKYGFDSFPAGAVLTPAVRRVYRDAVTGALPLVPPPARPVSNAGELVRWLRTPVQCAPWARFAPADIALWRSRPDLKSTFPSIFGAASLYFRRWLDSDPSVPLFYGELNIGEPETSQGGEHYGARRPSGWSIVACGEPEPSGETLAVARRAAWEATRAGFPAELVEPVPSDRRLASLWAHRGMGAHEVHDNVIVCVDAGHFSEDRIVQALAGRAGRKVGLWLSADSPTDTRLCHVLDSFDELWVLSKTTERALKAFTHRPVILVRLTRRDPEPVEVGGDDLRWLRSLRGNGPLFLVPIDARSDFEQQNPVAAIAAYRGAFEPDVGARLLVHVRYGELTRLQVETIRHACGDRTDIVLATADLAARSEGSIVDRVDCVVSLHRSSAFGMALADAAACGTPIVATGYSAPMTYLDGDCAQLVPYALVRRPTTEPSPLGQLASEWAEPDVKAASSALRALAGDEGRVQRLPERVRTDPNGARAVRDVIRQFMLDPDHGKVVDSIPLAIEREPLV